MLKIWEPLFWLSVLNLTKTLANCLNLTILKILLLQVDIIIAIPTVRVNSKLQA